MINPLKVESSPALPLLLRGSGPTPQRTSIRYKHFAFLLVFYFANQLLFLQAEERIIQHRWRLTHRGVAAERLQPEWCRQNAGQCYVSDWNPNPPKNDKDKDTE